MMRRLDLKMRYSGLYLWHSPDLEPLHFVIPSGTETGGLEDRF